MIHWTDRKETESLDTKGPSSLKDQKGKISQEGRPLPLWNMTFHLPDQDQDHLLSESWDRESPQLEAVGIGDRCQYAFEFLLKAILFQDILTDLTILVEGEIFDLPFGVEFFQFYFSHLK